MRERCLLVAGRISCQMSHKHWVRLVIADTKLLQIYTGIGCMQASCNFSSNLVVGSRAPMSDEGQFTPQFKDWRQGSDLVMSTSVELQNPTF